MVRAAADRLGWTEVAAAAQKPPERNMKEKNAKMGTTVQAYGLGHDLAVDAKGERVLSRPSESVSPLAR